MINSKPPSIDDIIVAWPNIVRALKHVDNQLQAIARSINPIFFHDKTLIINANFEFFFKKFEGTQNKHLLEKVISEHIGCQISTIYVIIDKSTQQGTDETAQANNVLVLDDLKSIWPNIVRELKAYNPQLQALARNIHPIHIQNTTLIIHADFKFHKEKFELPQSKELLEKIISKHAGQKISTAYVMISGFSEEETPSMVPQTLNDDAPAFIDTKEQESILLEQIKASWRDIIYDLKPKSPQLMALLRNIHPSSVQGDIVHLKADFKFHKEFAERPSNKKLLEETISNRLGFNISIICSWNDDSNEQDSLHNKDKPIIQTKKSENTLIEDPMEISVPTFEASVDQPIQTTEEIHQEELETINYAQDIIQKQGITELANSLGDILVRYMSNQQVDEFGLNTGNVGSIKNSEIFHHDGLQFRSRSEIAIYNELKSRHVLFFPNVAAILGGKNMRKEPDFLICQNGKWGVLEVSGLYSHPTSRAPSDHERQRLFGDYGLTCFYHYEAKKCFDDPKWVVDDFLKRLDAWKMLL